MESYKVKLKKISTFIFDVDGVFTNGQILLYNDDFLRSFNAKDGYAVQYASKMGYLIFIITGGDSKEVKNGLLNLGVNEVHLKSNDKLTIYTDILKRFSLSNACGFRVEYTCHGCIDRALDRPLFQAVL